MAVPSPTSGLVDADSASPANNQLFGGLADSGVSNGVMAMPLQNVLSGSQNVREAPFGLQNVPSQAGFASHATHELPHLRYRKLKLSRKGEYDVKNATTMCTLCPMSVFVRVGFPLDSYSASPTTTLG